MVQIYSKVDAQLSLQVLTLKRKHEQKGETKCKFESEIKSWTDGLRLRRTSIILRFDQKENTEKGLFEFFSSENISKRLDEFER
ncbi:hypothetical protein K7X08_035822 [Anisodus acutangulus]|uniref:Uncharacterized protein n=1 Tax=Anisodus acutangulus TaxID=402998 RepID=A0A9Q1QXG9_9SOLA|nr:hypothetical protein K7X08_035822 [Anisodus acutangulus]